MPATKLKEKAAPPAFQSSTYEADFYTWTLEQAAALRDGRIAELDIEHLAEEIEDLGKEVFGKLASSFRVVLIYLLKWDHQPERRSRSWVASIDVHRVRIGYVLEDNPALSRRQAEAIARAYREARIKAAFEMKRDKRELPSECPYGIDDILSRPIEWPET